jgi:sugar phosphate isomerase/epimerase
MLLSTNISNALMHYSAEKTVDMLQTAGFTAIDFSFFDPVWYSEEREDVFFSELRKYAENAGMCFNQAHAPFHSSFPDKEQTKSRFQEIVCALRRAALLGAKTIVVHPVQHLKYADEGVPEQLFEMNMEFYGKLILYCQEYGIQVAVENMWQYHPWPKITHSTCSTPEEMNRYLDALNSPWITGCLDVGHASLVGQSPDEFVMAMGSDRLGALHIHDVTKTEDSHMMPYQGVIDWQKLMHALGAIGYQGDLTFECDGFFKNLPAELYPDALRLLAHTGRVLINEI